jgi:hypothetical protein
MLAAAAIAAVLMVAPANTATVFDFTTGLADEGGTISWDGTNPIGPNIPIGAFLVKSLYFNTSPDSNFITTVALMDGTLTSSDTDGHVGGSITTSNLPPDGTPGSVIITDIRNTGVPEPAAMMLLGMGLLAVFRARRQRPA